MTDITAATPARPVARPATPRPRASYERDEGARLTLEDAGFSAQPPARDLRGDRRRDLQARRPDARLHVGRHRGELAPARVHQLRRRPRRVGERRRPGAAVLRAQLPDVTQWVAPVAPAAADADAAEAAARVRGDAGRRRRRAAARRRGRPHRVARPRPDGRARPARDGPGLDRGPGRRRRSPSSRRSTARPACARRSSRSRTSGSPSRTARRTRWSSSRGSTPARPCAARTSRSSAATTRCSGPAPPAPTASRSRRTPLRDADDWWKFAFIVTAEKDGDVAYVGSDWNEGIQPWDFGVPFNLNEAIAAPARHGVHRSRRVQARRRGARSRRSCAQRARRHPAAAARARAVFVTVRDGQNRVVDERTIKVNAWSSAEWTLTLPAEGSLGNYSMRVMLESDRPKPRRPSSCSPARRPDAGRGRLRALHEGGQRLVPGRGVPPSRLPRRRHADRRPAHRGRSAERRGHRALPVRRADGRAADARGRSRGRRLVDAPAAVTREVSRRSLGLRRLVATRTTTPEPGRDQAGRGRS